MTSRSRLAESGGRSCGTGSSSRIGSFVQVGPDRSPTRADQVPKEHAIELSTRVARMPGNVPADTASIGDVLVGALSGLEGGTNVGAVTWISRSYSTSCATKYR